MKTLILIFGSMALLGLGCIIGYRSLVSHIYNKVDCQEFNIDNIEVRTGIDIPPVTKAECQCNEDKTVKISTFTLDSAKLDLESYVLRNKFELKDGQYQNLGKRPDTHWKATLDQESYELKVVVEYF